MKFLAYTLLFTANTLHAQYSLGSKNEAGGMNAVLARNEWAINGNPSGITAVSKTTLALDYRQAFISREIKTVGGVVVIPVKEKYYLGLGFHRFGIDVYQELKCALTYAQKFGKLSLAINQNFHQLNVSQYFNKTGYSIDAGLQYQYIRQLILGAYIQNVGHLGYKNDMNFFPSMTGFGARWLLDRSVSVNMGLYIPLYADLPSAFRLGVDYGLLEKLVFRAGISSAPFAYYLGAGIQCENFILDMAYRQQIVLGGQPQLTISYVL